MDFDDDEQLPEELSDRFAIIGSFASARKAHEAGLVILAAGKHYWLRVSEGRFLLVVPRADADSLKNEISLFQSQNRFWPPLRLRLPDYATSKAPTFLALFLLVTVFSLQNAYPFLQALGANNSQTVFPDNQYWRLFTAITLHADISHLAGNLMGLALFGYFAARYFGNGLAWLMTLLAAAFSNATYAFLKLDTDYLSLGASTAVFAALGLLAGAPLGAFIRSRTPFQTRDWLLPFFGGCILFAWMGGGDFPTDVAAHAWSFVYGSAFAIAATFFDLRQRLSTNVQRTLLAAATLLPILAWLYALWVSVPASQLHPLNS